MIKINIQDPIGNPHRASDFIFQSERGATVAKHLGQLICMSPEIAQKILVLWQVTVISLIERGCLNYEKS